MKSVFLSIVMLVISIYAPSTLHAASGSAGTEFYFAFQPNLQGYYASGRALTLFVTGKQDTQGTVTIPDLNFTQAFDVQANKVTQIAIPVAAQFLGLNTISKLGVHVVAQKEVTIYGANQGLVWADAFLALPVNSLGTEYMAMSYKGVYYGYSYRDWPSTLAVVGAYDNTTVTITPSVEARGHQAGVPFTVLLNKGDTYQIYGALAYDPTEVYKYVNSDLTGTTISATSPVAVMSGSQLSPAYIFDWPSHIAEMPSPVNTWGKTFLTVPLAGHQQGEVVRILASQDNTLVKINGVSVSTLSRGKFYETTLIDRSQIETSAPVLVAHYAISADYGKSTAPFMILITPTEQFLNQSTFSTLPRSSAHYMNIVAPTASISSIRLNGTLINSALFSPIGSSEYSGAQVAIPSGTHIVNSDTPLGVYVYGYRISGEYTSYGFPGERSYRAINQAGDSFVPSIKLTQVGDTIQGVATDSEDINCNGLLDSGEDLNNNDITDRRSEDLNGNGILDPGEDLNGDGLLDKDTGIFRVELEAGSSNLKLEILPFIPGEVTAYFSISLLDPKLPGSGILLVSDGVGNVNSSPVSLTGTPLLKDVRIIDTISTSNIDIDASSYSKVPYSVTVIEDRTVIEWRFDTFPADSIQDFGFDLIVKNPVAGEQRLISHKLELTYLDQNGKQVRTELDSQYARVLNSAFDSTITPDKSTYPANENVLLNVRLNNLSEYARTIDARIIIEDSQGILVKEVAILPTQTLTPGTFQEFANITFNTGSILAGDYKARLFLSESNRPVGEAAAIFKIQPTITLNSKVATDKTSYTANERVALEANIQNLSSNFNISALTATVSIVNDQGFTLFTDVKTFTLMVAASSTFKTYWNTGIYPAGSYRVTLVVSNAAGDILSTSTSDLLISSITLPSKLLKGHVNLNTQSIFTGDPVTATYNITNLGNIDLSDIAISVQTVNMTGQTVYNTIADQANLVKGATFTNSGVIDTQTYGAKDYVVILRATINGIEETLASNYFRVEGSPSAPSLYAPAQGVDVEVLTPALTVSNASDPNDDTLTYEFEVYADSNLANKIIYGTAAEMASITKWAVPTSLAENQTYYWRARAYDGKLYGPWMALASFRVNIIDDPPTAPTITNPVDGFAVAIFTPTLTVNNASDPDSVNLTYNFDVALDPGFTQIVATTKGATSGVGSSSWTVPLNLQENSWYYWRAQADDWLIEGPWSTTARFFVNTTNEAPTTPVIAAPANNATVTALSTDVVVVSTDIDSPALTYYFEVDTVPTFDSPIIIRSESVTEDQGTTHWHVNGLQDNTRYFVRVKASDGSADSPWSIVTTFFANTVNDPPTIPILANPSNGAGVNLFTPTLLVHNSTDLDMDSLTYEFEIYADATLTNPVASSGPVAESVQLTSWIAPVTLVENQTYYWRSRAYDGSLYSNWMPTASFMVNTANDAPGAPKISSPASGDSVSTLTPTLAVENAADPDSNNLTYEFEIYAGDTLIAADSSIQGDVSGITSWATTIALSDNTAYQWRARAFDGDSYGPWTPLAAFTLHLPKEGLNAMIKFDPATLNKSSNGNWVTVYIELPAGYKATDIVISSLKLEGTVPAETKPYSIGDYNKNGTSDLMVKFSRSSVQSLLSDGNAVPVHIAGKVGTTSFEGVDIIRVIH